MTGQPPPPSTYPRHKYGFKKASFFKGNQWLRNQTSCLDGCRWRMETLQYRHNHKKRERTNHGKDLDLKRSTSKWNQKNMI